MTTDTMRGWPQKFPSAYFRGILKKDFIIGLDIGTGSIKLAQFIKKEDGLHLIRAGLEEIAHVGDEASREKEILSALKKLLQGVDIKKSKFIAVINCPKTAVKKITAPYMPMGELGEGIKLEAKNYFPFSIDDALLDFEILGETVEKGARKYKLLVATSPEKTVGEYTSLLNKLGIKPYLFIPAPLALQKVIENSRPEKDEVKAILEIGANFTELAIFSGKDLVFSRKIPVAGNDFTKALTGVLVSDKGRTELSIEEAERIKLEIGVPAEGESAMIEDKISTTQVLSMIRAPLEQLAGEIDRCFGYYREETEAGKVSSLILLGGGASLKGLARFLFEELGIEVKPGNPLEGVKIEPGAIAEKGEPSYRLASAIGAALSEAKGINLLPAELKEEAKRTFKRATVETIAVSVALILIFIYTGMRIQLSNYQKKISVAKMELSSLGPQLKEVEAQNLSNIILAGEPYWEDVFKELSNIVPDDIYLIEFAMQNKTLKIRGVAVSREPEEALSNFIFALKEGIFKNVKLVTTKEIKKTVNEFKLECRTD